MNDILAIAFALVAGRLAVIGYNKFSANEKPMAALLAALSVAVFWAGALVLKHQPL